MNLKRCIESLPHARHAASTALFLFGGRGRAKIWKAQIYWLVSKLQLAVHYTLQSFFTVQFYSNNRFTAVFPIPCKTICYAIPKVGLKLGRLYQLPRVQAAAKLTWKPYLVIYPQCGLAFAIFSQYCFNPRF